MSIDTKKQDQDWLPILELRKIEEDISAIGQGREPLEVKKLASSVFYRELKEQDIPQVPETFDTQYGVYLNDDRVGFNSWLSQRSKESFARLEEAGSEDSRFSGDGGYFVDGQFCDMFDCGAFIFAISNLKQQGRGLLKIIRIHENYRAVTMFDSRSPFDSLSPFNSDSSPDSASPFDSDSSPHFSSYDYVGRYENNLGFMVVVSGVVESNAENTHERIYENKTILFQLYTDGSIAIDREWDISINPANSIVSLGDDVYFGQSNRVTVLNTLTGEVTYLTNKSDEELAALREFGEESS